MSEEITIENKIKEAFVNHLLMNAKEPISILQFTTSIEISEEEFYAHFNSFKSVEKAVWTDFILNTIEVLENDPEYENYSAREKTLAFFYTLIEILKQNRSLVLFRLECHNLISNGIPYYLNDFLKAYTNYLNQILAEATEQEEILARPLLTEQYIQAYKILLAYVLKVWINDSSKEYQTTDAAIEKTVNLSFDLLQRGPLDGIIDFVKFAIQNKAF